MRGVLSTSDVQTWLGTQVVADHLVQCGPEPEEDELPEPQYGPAVELTEIFRER